MSFHPCESTNGLAMPKNIYQCIVADIAKSPSIWFVPFYTSTSNLGKYDFPECVINF